MKKWILSTLLLVFGFYSAPKATAQSSKMSWAYATNCLSLSAKVTLYDSCYSYVWTVAGGSSTTTYTGGGISHTFSAPGTYKVCMNAKNNCKKWDTTICQQITVDTCPCSYTPYIVLTQDTANCYKYKYMAYPAANSSTAGTFSYYVNFGDNSTASTTRDGVHTFAKDGTYKVCVTVKFATKNGYCYKDYCKTITVKCSTGGTTKCKWNYTPSINITNKCNSYRFEATNQYDSCVTYKWTLDSGTTGTGNVFEKKFTTKGAHSICVRYYNACTGCDTTVCTKFQVSCVLNCTWNNVAVNYKATTCSTYTFEASNLNDTCVSYTCLVNNKVYSYNRLNSFTFTDGKYYVGYRFYNKCTGCDTIVWKFLTIACNNNTKKCTWPSNLGFGITMPGCPYLRIVANATNDSCIQISCVVNDTAKAIGASTPGLFYYKMPKNGTYKVCMKFYNPCTGCDTVICKSWTTDCIGSTTPKCSWSNMNFNYSNKCKTYTFEATNANDTCVKYAYKISLNNGTYKTTNDRVFTYEFPANGTYTVCLTVTNKCKGCDTTICKTVVVSCQTSSKCSFINNMPSFGWSNSGCAFVFEAKNMNNSCIKYKWYIGDSAYTAVLTGRVVNYTFKGSGIHHIYLFVSDTCNSCDTFVHREVNGCGTASVYNTTFQTATVKPNPAQTQFSLDGVSFVGTLTVYDELGRIILQVKDQMGTSPVKCEHWQPGIYQVEFRAGDRTYRSKLIKN